MAGWRGSVLLPLAALVLILIAAAVVPLVLQGTAPVSPAALKPAPAPTASISASPTPTPPIVAADPFWETLVLRRMGLGKEAVEAARSALPDALKKDPSTTLPPEIVTLGAAPSDPFAAPKSLALAGFDAEAKAAFKKAVAEDPAASIPPELAYLSDRPIRDWRDADMWSAAGVLLMNAAVVIAVVAAALFVVWPILRRIFLVRVQIGKFDGEPDLKIGDALETAVENELLQLRREGGSSSLKFVRGPDTALSIPDPVKELSPSVKLAAALLELIPSRIHVLTATLQPHSERGVGLTVSIAGPRGAISASTTLWEAEFDPGYQPPSGDADTKSDAGRKAYRRLALAAASWAIYQPPLEPGDPLRKGYLSRDWRSYALHRIAVSWEDVKQRESGRSLYFSALDADPENAGALFNLAQIEGDTVLDGSLLPGEGEERFGRAIARARLAIDLVQRRAKEREATAVARDRFTYRVHYGVARLALHRALSDPPPADRAALLEEAEREAVAVLMATQRYRDRPVKGSELGRFVRRIEDATIILLAGTWEELVREGRSEIPASLTKLPSPIERDDGSITLVSERRREPERLVRDLVGHPDHPEWRMALDRWARYNLACYFCGQRDPEQALKDLAYGLRPGLADAARHDPSLKAFQPRGSAHFDKEWITKFDELVCQFDVPPAATPTSQLARVGRIGPTFAARLAERQIKTPDDLETHLRDPILRVQLAEDVKASPDLVMSWAQIFELRRLRGLPKLELAEAELLYEAGLTSPDDLLEWEAGNLAELLRDLNTARKRTDHPPGEDTVDAWIESARP